MTISDAAVDAAMKGAHSLIFENLSMPFGASIRDYPNHDDLRAADEAADKANDDIFRAIFRAALEAAAPVLQHEAWLLGHAAGRDYQGDGWNRDAHNPEIDSPYVKYLHNQECAG